MAKKKSYFDYLESIGKMPKQEAEEGEPSEDQLWGSYSPHNSSGEPDTSEYERDEHPMTYMSKGGMAGMPSGNNLAPFHTKSPMGGSISQMPGSNFHYPSKYEQNAPQFANGGMVGHYSNPYSPGGKSPMSVPLGGPVSKYSNVEMPNHPEDPDEMRAYAQGGMVGNTNFGPDEMEMDEEEAPEMYAEGGKVKKMSKGGMMAFMQAMKKGR